MFFISVYLIRSSVIRVIEFTFWGNNIVRFLAKIEYTLTCRIIVQQILLIFWEKNTYTALLGPTRLLILR